MPDGNVLGKVGEHNATVLRITPPEYMSANESILFYCLAFETGNNFIKKIIRSEMIAKADVIHVPVWGQVTVSENVRFQLEGYDGENNLLVKSVPVEGVFSPSVCGVQSASDFGNNGLAASVAANTLARHTHENASVLGELGEDINGNLNYKGKEIKGNRATSFLDFTYDDNIMLFEETFGQFGVVIGAFPEPHPILSAGTEIADIQVMIPDCNNDEWFSLKDAIAFDRTPYVSLASKIFHSQDYEMDIWLHLISFSYPLVNIGEALANYGYTAIRIIYYTD